MTAVLEPAMNGVYFFTLLIVAVDAGAIASGDRQRRRAAQIREELFPFIPLLALLDYFVQVFAERGEHPLVNPGAIVRLVGWGLVWFAAYKQGGGGGRWKRRLRKVASRVAVQGSRLAVVRVR